MLILFQRFIPSTFRMDFSDECKNIHFDVYIIRKGFFAKRRPSFQKRWWCLRQNAVAVFKKRDRLWEASSFMNKYSIS